MKWVVLTVVLALFVLGAAASGSGSSAGPGPFKVGLVLEPTGTNVTYDRLFVAGLRRAVRNLGVKGTVLTPGAKEGYLPSFLSLARQHYDLVIAWSADQASAVDTTALQFPHSRFVFLDAPRSWLPHRPKNVWSVTFAEQEAGYLAGYLAGLVEQRRPGRDTVGAVGGIKFPPVDRYIAGFEAGARAADPGIRTFHAYAQDFVDAAKCKRIAADQIARGSEVIFDVAGACGLGALEEAKQEHVWGIGVDVDQSSLGPYILTSAVKKVDVAVYESIKATRAGRFVGGRTAVLGIREGAVGLGRISPRVPQALVAKVQRVRQQVAAGKIGSIPTTVP